MSQITDQAESLRQQAISLLMAERQTIDQKLAMLGADGTEMSCSVAAPRACRKCGGTGHNTRTCKQQIGRTDAVLIPSD